LPWQRIRARSRLPLWSRLPAASRSGRAQVSWAAAPMSRSGPTT